MKQAIRYVCDECDTESLEFPATVIWDSAAQMFALSGGIDIARKYCVACNDGTMGFHVEVVGEAMDDNK